MEKNIAIQVEDLGKRYKIGARQESYRTLRDTITRFFSFPYRLLKRSGSPLLRGGHSHFWALKDVSLEIKAGEVAGIIGSNGAGKTTLLKILSRITDPTEGRAKVYGRVGSLLEVGTGFHPELTGRENIYLNGAILGMRKKEIERKFDEIVAFSEVEKFLDTAVKHYSSGMYMRLAFAVAAHLEPEILLVDEVLAVGDAAFQDKCLGKMGDVAREGRTVMFVSHNLQAVRQLCDRVYLLNNGHLVMSGPADQVIASYLGSSVSQELTGLDRQTQDDDLQVTAIKMMQDGFESKGILVVGRPFEVHIQYQTTKDLTGLLLGFDLYSSDGVQLFRTYDSQSCDGLRPAGNYDSVCHFPGVLLNNGAFFLDIIIGIHRTKWISRGRIRVKLRLDGRRSSDIDYPGIIAPILDWDVIPENTANKLAQQRD